MEFDVSLLVIMVTFGVSYLITRSFLFRPVLALLEEREGEMRSAQQIYDEARAETEAALEQERARFTELRQEASQRRDVQRREAQGERQELMDSAKRAAAERLAAAQAELESALESERSALRTRVEALARDMADKLIRVRGAA